MENEKLAEILMKLKITKNYFRGVYRSYNLNKVEIDLSNKNFVIINTAKASETRGHFILFYISPKAKFYLDSLNESVTSYSEKIFDFYEKFGPFVSPPFRVQSLRTNVCSYYIIFWCVQLAGNKNYTKIDALYENFDPHKLQANDTLVTKYVRKLLND